MGARGTRLARLCTKEDVGVHETRRRAREILGWSILTTVGTLSRLALWIDAAANRSDDGDR